MNNKLAALQGIVESGDYKPTDQSYAVFKELSARLDQQVGELDALAETESDGAEQAARRREAGNGGGGEIGRVS